MIPPYFSGCKKNQREIRYYLKRRNFGEWIHSPNCTKIGELIHSPKFLPAKISSLKVFNWVLIAVYNSNLSYVNQRNWQYINWAKLNTIDQLKFNCWTQLKTQSKITAIFGFDWFDWLNIEQNRLQECYFSNAANEECAIICMAILSADFWNVKQN